MIPYEELERALSRWKARRSGTVESTSESVPEAADDPDATPSGIRVVAVPSSYAARDTTNEVELSDAEVDDSS